MPADNKLKVLFVSSGSVRFVGYSLVTEGQRLSSSGALDSGLVSADRWLFRATLVMERGVKVPTRALENCIAIQTAFLILIIVMCALGYGRLVRLERSLGRISVAIEQVAQPVGLRSGSLAPDFTLTGTEGDSVTLSDFSDGKVLIMFSDVKCMFCQSAYPSVSEFAYSHSDVAPLVISRGTADDNRSIQERLGDAVHVMGWYDAVAMAYNVPGTPYFFALDAQGKVIAHGFASGVEEIEALFAD